MTRNNQLHKGRSRGTQAFIVAMKFCLFMIKKSVLFYTSQSPGTVMLAEVAEEGLLLATVHV